MTVTRFLTMAWPSARARPIRREVRPLYSIVGEMANLLAGSSHESQNITNGMLSLLRLI